MEGVINFSNLQANVQRVKCYIFTTNINYYIMTEFDYVKSDSHLAAYMYGGVVLQCSQRAKTALDIIAKF